VALSHNSGQDSLSDTELTRVKPVKAVKLMAITRKKTLGFSEEAELPTPETEEVSTVAETLPEVEITPEHEPDPEPTPAPEPELPPAPVLLPAPTHPSPVQSVQPVRAVKKHPRNIPKFAAWK
jgi:hypothetical protein